MRTKFPGISLIELGMVMVLISLAMVPIVQMVGGGRSATGGGNATEMVGQKSKEIIFANALVERALSKDWSTFNCGGAGFNPTTSLPAPGVTVNFPTASRCLDNTYSQPLYYQWTVRNANSTVTYNQYYQVVLNVWNKSTGGNPILTLPTTLFWNSSPPASSTNTTGIKIVLDVSGSMSESLTGNPGLSGGVASPFLNYRFPDPGSAGPWPYAAYTPPAAIALPWNVDNKLDIVSLLDVDDPKTGFDDRYLHVGSLGVTQCPGADPLWQIKGNFIKNLCQSSGGPNGIAWQNTVDSNLSKMEAARSSLLNMLLSFEADPQLYQNTKLGLVSFDANIYQQVPMEGVDATNRYPNMRRKLSWVNRIGPGQIHLAPGGGTNTYFGIKAAADEIFADPTLDNRIIFVATDGEPTAPNNNYGNDTAVSHVNFTNLAKQIGNGTYPGANGNKATIFTLALLDNSAQTVHYLQTDLANNTPGGQFFSANSIADVSPIFSQIQYQIQRIILLNKSNRYNVDFG